MICHQLIRAQLSCWYHDVDIYLLVILLNLPTSLSLLWFWWYCLEAFSHPIESALVLILESNHSVRILNQLGFSIISFLHFSQIISCFMVYFFFPMTNEPVPVLPNLLMSIPYFYSGSLLLVSFSSSDSPSVEPSSSFHQLIGRSPVFSSVLEADTWNQSLHSVEFCFH